LLAAHYHREESRQSNQHGAVKTRKKEVQGSFALLGEKKERPKGRPKGCGELFTMQNHKTPSAKRKIKINS